MLHTQGSIRKVAAESCKQGETYVFHTQGSFRKVAAESESLAREVAERLKARMTDRPEEAAECLQLMQRLGEPTEHLQVWLGTLQGLEESIMHLQLSPGTSQAAAHL